MTFAGHGHLDAAIRFFFGYLFIFLVVTKAPSHQTRGRELSVCLLADRESASLLLAIATRVGCAGWNGAQLKTIYMLVEYIFLGSFKFLLLFLGVFGCFFALLYPGKVVPS